MATLKITCDNDKLLNQLKRQILIALTQYEIEAKSGGDKRSAQVAASNTRIVRGAK